MLPRYLRISVTGRCNLHCLYCRPEGARCPAPVSEPSVEQISVLVRCAAAEGIRKVRITGGEPLLRDDLEDIVRAVRSTTGIAEVNLTTNAIGLDRRAEALRQAGLERVNVSLDTLRPERFLAITGRDRHGEVLAGIEAAADVFHPVKLNTVLLRGINDDEIVPLVEFAARRGLWIRFIERYGSPWAAALPDGCLPADEVRARLREAFGRLEPLPSAELSVEETYALPGAGGVKVGLISSVTCPPCEACSKLRFTASGELRACLYADCGTDLTPLLRRRDVPAIRAAIRSAFAAKRRDGPPPSAVVPVPISQIGG